MGRRFKYGRSSYRGVGVTAKQRDFYGGRPLPPAPTSAEPGTREKISVMASRWLMGYHIHHPDDQTDKEDTT